MDIKPINVLKLIKCGHIYTNSKPIKHFKCEKRDFLHVKFINNVINLVWSIG